MSRKKKFLIFFATTAAIALLFRNGNLNRAKIVNMGTGNAFPCGRHNPEVRFDRIPHCKGTGHVSGSYAHFSYNALGLRDRDYPPKAPPGFTRILMLDGSVMVGSGLEENLSPVRQLENELHKKGWKNVEVINGAVEGFTTVQNAIRLPKYIEAYNPDIIILYSIGNFKMFFDFVMGQYLDRSAPTPQKKNRLRLISPLAYLPDFLKIENAEFMSATYTIHDLYQRMKATFNLMLLDPDQQENSIMEVTMEMLETMRDRAFLSNARFFVLWDGLESSSDIYLQSHHKEYLFRFFRFLFPRFTVSAKNVEETLREKGIEVISIADEYRKIQDDHYHLERDHHWNALGSLEFAKMSAEKIVRLRAKQNGQLGLPPFEKIRH